MSKLHSKRNIEDYDSITQLIMLKTICNQIYIARNISLSEEEIQKQFKQIDELFRDKDNFN